MREQLSDGRVRMRELAQIADYRVIQIDATLLRQKQYGRSRDGLG